MLNKKAISLLSGGLDSVLATRLMKDQGIEVVALHFTSPFCNCNKGNGGCGLQAVSASRELGVRVVVRAKGLEYMDIVRKPRHGYGRNMNPCIDCRIFILRKAREVMEAEGASFVITGEVLGQRPMSQTKRTIRLIEKESGLEGLILRPLSAKYFPATIPEQQGIVDREKLLDISGRSRKRQFALADTFDLKEFGCPGGGCLLTDSLYVPRVKDLLDHDSDLTMRDVSLLRIGRHFRLSADAKLIVGRNKEENDRLVALASPPYVRVSPVGFQGPEGLLAGIVDDRIVEMTARIMGHYGKQETGKVSIELHDGTGVRHTVDCGPVDLDQLKL
jgi:tRNA U34 2-thiouridine synthase MnmA/TrmU